MRTFDELAEDLEAHDGVRTYTMEELLTIYGVKRADVRVLEDIANSLKRRDIGTEPKLSTDPKEPVRLYSKISDIGELHAAIAKPDERGDAYLRVLVQSWRLHKKTMLEIKRLSESL